MRPTAWPTKDDYPPWLVSLQAAWSQLWKKHVNIREVVLLSSLIGVSVYAVWSNYEAHKLQQKIRSIQKMNSFLVSENRQLERSFRNFKNDLNKAYPTGYDTQRTP